MAQQAERKGLGIDRLVIVSNRLPNVLMDEEVGAWRAHPSSGGLVTALAPVLEETGGLWIGWRGTAKEVDTAEPMAIGSRGEGYTLRSVPLTTDEVNLYYYGFSNQVIWPLFHDLQSRCNFDAAYWHAYQEVNGKFAQAIADVGRPNDLVWVHDYHLMLVARELRALGVKSRVAFFLHTPFPSLDMYMKLPWRREVLEGLLDYDLVGFQTQRDRNNFCQCAEMLTKGVRVDCRRVVCSVARPQQYLRAGAFPISIDFREFARQARDPTVGRRMRELRRAMPDRQIILGVDRLDYSKGIPERLRAFGNALERFEGLRGRVSLLQVVVPSREEMPDYQELKAEIELLVGEINGRFTWPGWIPIHYMFRSLDRSELLAYYRAADMAVVTPLKDGMNLIAKEYCAANMDTNGVLILSEFAGAATQLGGQALLVNPYDVDDMAAAIWHAFNMDQDERQSRMRRLRNAIARRDIFWWLDAFLRAAVAGDRRAEVGFPAPGTQ
ncbi:MAG: alpha,alpha-trehalose-phosphate synthase (UDP-forming) [Chloroflexota bacterium]